MKEQKPVCSRCLTNCCYPIINLECKALLVILILPIKLVVTANRKEKVVRKTRKIVSPVPLVLS